MKPGSNAVVCLLPGATCTTPYGQIRLCFCDALDHHDIVLLFEVMIQL